MHSLSHPTSVWRFAKAPRIATLLALLLLAACNIPPEPEQNPVTPPAGVTPGAVATVPSPASPSPSPVTATSRPTITPLPTATATATPRPLAIIAVPPGWEQAAIAATGTLAGAPWRWQVTASAEAATAVEYGEAQLALVPGSTGIPAGHRPLALAVPFTTAWEATTLAQAQEIQTNGHPLVTVVPWDEMTPELRALRVGGLYPTDPDYPLQEPLSLQAQPGFEEAASLLAPALESADKAGNDGLLRLTAVGDIMLDRTLGVAIDNGRLDYPFAQVAPLLQGADIAVGNLECALGDLGEPAGKSYTFRAPPAAAQSLAQAGFDVLTLANNHALDYGPDALLQGIDLLRQAGIQAVGAGADAAAAHAPARWQGEGLTLAFLGYVAVPVEGRPPYFDAETWAATVAAPGMAWATPAQIAADVAAARQQADHVVVLLHSGYEYVPSPSEEQIAAAHAAIDAGATLVLGHHAHILQGVQFYNGGVIAYGLGNFAFTIDGPPETALLNVWLDRDGVRALDVVPAIVQPGGQPRLATPVEAEVIRGRLYTLTNALNPR